MSLPEPSFIDRDANAVTADLIAFYEAISGKTLQPAQPEMLLINLTAYRETLLRVAIQAAAKQNLVSFAVYPMLDYLGELVGCTRLAAAAARCTLGFTLIAPQPFDVTIPAATQVESKDGLQIFATDTLLTISAGQLSGNVAATAEIAGVAANGYGPGDINNLTAPLALVSGAASTTMTTGGADVETDDRYRSRIKTAPEAFSVAGSIGAYSYWAKSAHQEIVDVTVTSPSAGVVNIYPLMSTGAPAAEILDLVAAVVAADTVRPLTDNVTVLAPTPVDFVIEADVTFYTWADAASVTSQINDALAVYAAGLKARLGMDIVTSQIIGQISRVYGVYQTVLTQPSADRILATTEWANCLGTTITAAGLANG